MTHRNPFLILFSLSLLFATQAIAIEPTTVARLVERSMVRVIVKGPAGAGSASGFVVSREGHIATAYHAIKPHIEMSWDLFVVESGAAPKTRRTATLIKAYPDEDLAVLKVEKLDRPAIALSESEIDTLAKGMAVFAIG